MVSWQKFGVHAPAYVAVVLSATVIAVSWVATIQLFQSITSFYDEILEEMGQFKVIAGDTWNRMVDLRKERDFREKRYASDYGSRNEYARAPQPQCNCGPRTSNCPRGPPGPPGDQGYPGEAGERGQEGRPGAHGISLVYQQKEPGCIRCPMGHPGMPGNSGLSGIPGQNGEPGMPGQMAQAGGPGSMGPTGDPGQPGNPGSCGPPGSSGENGYRSRSPPGSPGPAGSQGQPGNPGQPGYSPPPGPMGPVGQMGAPGNRGIPGNQGRPGTPGSMGGPGTDAQYCPCPKRGAVVQPNAYTTAYRPQNAQYNAPYGGSSYGTQSPDYRRRLFAKFLRAKHRKVVAS